jgi:HSP20 family molecular chaperone IbpA
MLGRKQSFLEHLTGSRSVEEEELEQEDMPEPMAAPRSTRAPIAAAQEEDEDLFPPEEEEDEIPGLAIDLYESDHELVLQCMIAGVTPENLHISITRNTVTLEGKRTGPQDVPEDQYVNRELYWGAFLREIELPFEIDPDGAEAIEKYGLLSIRLPRFDTARIQELKVKSV